MIELATITKLAFLSLHKVLNIIEPREEEKSKFLRTYDQQSKCIQTQITGQSGTPCLSGSKSLEDTTGT